MKPAAAEARLHVHKGPAIVFDRYEDMKAAVDDETLDVTADHVMIFRNAGPVGGPGMPEWGMMPIPTKLVKQGVRDMLRISDARMSRKAAWVAPEPSVTRGYQWMSAQHIQQADKGCDFDFLETSFGKTAGEPDIF